MTETVKTTEKAGETLEIRLKRLHLRSWRRGTKEMDLILGPWFDAEGAVLSEAELDAYELLLEENDWDLYYWVTGAQPCPEAKAPLIDRIAGHHALR